MHVSFPSMDGFFLFFFRFGLLGICCACTIAFVPTLTDNECLISKRLIITVMYIIVIDGIKFEMNCIPLESRVKMF